MKYEDALQRLETPAGRLFDRLPFPVWIKAICLALLVVALYSLFLLILGLPLFEPIFRAPDPFWSEYDTVLFIAVLCAYLYASEIYLARGSLTDIRDLAQHLSADTHETKAAQKINELSRFAHLASWVGAGVGLVYAFFFTGSGALFFQEGKVEAFLPIGLLTFPLMFSRAGRSIVIGNPTLTLFRQIDAPRFQVDVFDREAYRPFVRMGMRAALRWLFLFAILVGFLLDENNNNTIFGSLPMIYIMVGISALIATYEFVLPLVTARNFIVRDKTDELTWVISEIKERRQNLKAARDIETPRARLADLLAYKREIDHMHDWPVESPDIGRFVIYLLIPFLSWFGAAGAEVLVEGVFGGR